MGGLFSIKPEDLQRIAARQTWAIDPDGNSDTAANETPDSLKPLVSRRLAALGIGNAPEPTLVSSMWRF